MSKKCIRVGIIGCGARAVSYLQNFQSIGIEADIHVVAVYDPDKDRALKYLQTVHMENDVSFVQSFREVLDIAALDALIIGSPNYTHVEMVIEAFKKPCAILLEKPVAISVEECRQLWQAWKESGTPPVTVGFVLRYTPFLSKVQELLASSGLGQLLSVDSDESVGLGTTALFWRGWRSRIASSGGFLVEKCCHDFDMLRSLVGSNASRVYAVYRKTHLLASTPKAKRHPYFETASAQQMKVDYGTDMLHQAVEDAIETSFYEIQNEVPDHQSVVIEWDNGVLTNFMACIGQPRNTRRIRVYGSNFSIEGDMDRSQLYFNKIEDHTGEAEEQEFVIEHAATGHHGGDKIISESFWNQAAGVVREKPIAGIRDGIESVLIALAAQESASSGQSVDVRTIRRYVFGNDL